MERVSSILFNIGHLTGVSQDADHGMYFDDYRNRLQRQIVDALKDVEVGYIGGKSVAPKDTVQLRSIRMLGAIYERRRQSEDGMVPVEDVADDLGWSVEDAHETWRYSS